MKVYQDFAQLPDELASAEAHLKAEEMLARLAELRDSSPDASRRGPFELLPYRQRLGPELSRLRQDDPLHIELTLVELEQYFPAALVELMSLQMLTADVPLRGWLSSKPPMCLALFGPGMVLFLRPWRIVQQEKAGPAILL